MALQICGRVGVRGPEPVLPPLDVGPGLGSTPSFARSRTQWDLARHALTTAWTARLRMFHRRSP
eukprot:10266649-Alexandrium_andersonii.AAC.1